MFILSPTCSHYSFLQELLAIKSGCKIGEALQYRLNGQQFWFTNVLTVEFFSLFERRNEFPGNHYLPQ